MENQNARQDHGEKLWSLIPQFWCIWWIESVNTLDLLENVTLDRPKPYFAKIMIEKSKLNMSIQALKWSELVKDETPPLSKLQKLNYHLVPKHIVELIYKMYDNIDRDWARDNPHLAKALFSAPYPPKAIASLGYSNESNLLT